MVLICFLLLYLNVILPENRIVRTRLWRKQPKESTEPSFAQPYFIADSSSGPHNTARVGLRNAHNHLRMFSEGSDTIIVFKIGSRSIIWTTELVSDHFGVGARQESNL